MTVVIVIVAFLASVLTLFSGFGLGTLLMPVVAIFFPVAVAVALTAFVHLLNNLFKLGIFWKDINWDVSLKFGIPALLATIPGALILTHLEILPSIVSYQLFGINAAITPVKLAIGLLLIFFATIAAFAGVLAGKAGLKKITIGFIQKIIMIFPYMIGLLLTLGII